MGLWPKAVTSDICNNNCLWRTVAVYETSKKGLQLKKVVKYRAIACMLACRILFVTFTLPAIGLCFFFFCICFIVMRWSIAEVNKLMLFNLFVLRCWVALCLVLLCFFNVMYLRLNLPQVHLKGLAKENTKRHFLFRAMSKLNALAFFYLFIYFLNSLVEKNRLV